MFKTVQTDVMEVNKLKALSIAPEKRTTEEITAPKTDTKPHTQLVSIP